MRKLLATIICWFLAFSLGYSILPSSFNALINWLGPLFGTSFHLILSTLFLLLADPLKYTNIAIAWGVTGFLCGLIMRKRIGSITTALSVFSGQSIIMGLAGFRIFEIVNAFGINLSEIMAAPQKVLSLIPPVPEGASLSTILNAPIIAEIFQRVGGLTQTPSIDFIISLLVNTILLSVVKNIAIVCVAALVGCEVGKLASRPFRARIESFRTRFAKPTPPVASRLFVLGLAVLLASSMASMYPVSVEAASGWYYSETLIGTLTPFGTVVVTVNFFDTVYILRGIDTSDPAFSGCVVASLSTQRLSLESISADISLFSSQIPFEQLGLTLEQVLGMYAILSSTLLVLVYMDVPSDVAQGRARDAANIFSRGFGISLSQFPGMPQTQKMGENDEHNLVIDVYQSDKSFGEMATAVMSSLPEAERDGIATLIGFVYRNGIFTPSATPWSANGTVISTGFVNAQALLSAAGDEGLIGGVKPFLPTLGGPVPFINVLSYFAGRFHSSPITVHTLKFSDILDTDMPIKFSPSTNASTVITVVPMGNITKAGGVSIPTIKIATTLPASAVNTLASTIVSMVSGSQVKPGEKPPPELVSLSVETVSAGATVNPSAFEVTFTSRFPLQLRLVKSVSVKEVDRFATITITVTAYNDDVDPAQNVFIDDSAALQSYSQGAKLVSGESKSSWTSISSGTASGPSTRSVSYTLRLLKEGTYTFPAATVSYVYDGVTYTKASDKIVVRVRSPSLIQIVAEGIPSTWALMARMVNMIPGVQGNGSLILTIAVIAIVCLIAALEYRGFRKWVRGEAPKRQK